MPKPVQASRMLTTSEREACKCSVAINSQCASSNAEPKNPQDQPAQTYLNTSTLICRTCPLTKSKAKNLTMTVAVRASHVEALPGLHYKCFGGQVLGSFWGFGLCQLEAWLFETWMFMGSMRERGPEGTRSKSEGTKAPHTHTDTHTQKRSGLMSLHVVRGQRKHHHASPHVRQPMRRKVDDAGQTAISNAAN